MSQSDGVCRHTFRGPAKKLIGGLRYALKSSRHGSPFNCKTCSATERIQRNCGNHKRLSHTAIVWNEYKKEQKKALFESLKGQAKVYTLRDIRLYECPLKWITRDTSEVIRLLFLVNDTKALLWKGGWMNQPNWFVEAFEIFKREVKEWQMAEKSSS